MSRKSTRFLATAALGLGVFAVAVPAEAGFRSLRPSLVGMAPSGFAYASRSHGGAGVAAGLIGGLALGMLAASALQSEAAPAYAAAPIEPDGFRDMDADDFEARNADVEISSPRGRRSARARQRPRTSMRIGGTVPTAAVRACREALATASEPYGSIRVLASSAGPATRDGGGLRAPIDARIEYAAGRDVQVRTARVNCRLDARGRVIALR